MKKFILILLVILLCSLPIFSQSFRRTLNFGIWESGFALLDPDEDKYAFWDDSEEKMALSDTIQTNAMNDNQSYVMAGQLLQTLTDPLSMWAWITPATTEQDLTIENHDATYVAMETTDQAFQSMVWSLAFDGTAEYLTVADHDDFSFLSGGNDADMSIVVWAFVPDLTGTKYIITKADNAGGQNEWSFYFISTERLTLSFFDESVSGVEGRRASSGITPGAWYMLAATYDSAQQGTAASDGMLLYVNGAVVASGTDDGGSYVDKENGSQDPWIGSLPDSDVATGLWPDKMGIVILEQSTLSANTIHELYIATRGYYGQ